MTDAETLASKVRLVFRYQPGAWVSFNAANTRWIEVFGDGWSKKRLGRVIRNSGLPMGLRGATNTMCIGNVSFSDDVPTDTTPFISRNRRLRRWSPLGELA